MGGHGFSSFSRLGLMSVGNDVSLTFEGDNKLIWLLIILLVPALGPILYFAIGRQKKIKNSTVL